MENKIVLTMQDILDHEFKVDAMGYRMQEVDQYLDIIIKDYNEYNGIIKKLIKDKEDLIEENDNLKQEIRNLKQSIDTVKGNDKEITNVDLIRRVSQLEKIILGKEE